MLHRHVEVVGRAEGMERGEGLVFGEGKAGLSGVAGIRINREGDMCSEVGGEKWKARQTEWQVLPISHFCLGPDFSCPVTHR